MSTVAQDVDSQERPRGLRYSPRRQGVNFRCPSLPGFVTTAGMWFDVHGLVNATAQHGHTDRSLLFRQGTAIVLLLAMMVAEGLFDFRHGHMHLLSRGQH
jgi:hypothetical protein